MNNLDGTGQFNDMEKATANISAQSRTVLNNHSNSKMVKAPFSFAFYPLTVEDQLRIEPGRGTGSCGGCGRDGHGYGAYPLLQKHDNVDDLIYLFNSIAVISLTTCYD